MKRRKPLGRSKGLERSDLTVDPERVRAWQQRSREAARRSAGAKAHAPKRKGTAGKSAPASLQAKIGAVRFRARTPARERMCGSCLTARAAHWHHWLPQQQLRTYARGLARSMSEKALLRRLSELLRDERNLIALCRSCHELHETRTRPFTADDVPSAARTFAAELGPEWVERLARGYPSRPVAGSDDPRRIT